MATLKICQKTPSGSTLLQENDFGQPLAFSSQLVSEFSVIGLVAWKRWLLVAPSTG